MTFQPLADICPSCGRTNKLEHAPCANAWHDGVKLWNEAADFVEGFGCTMEIYPDETKAAYLGRFMRKLVAAMRAKGDSK